jgi:hypothetical protein
MSIYFPTASGFGLTPLIRLVPRVIHRIITHRFLKLDNWVTAPYKKPASLVEDNETFNNHVSMLRIRSEHSIGFVKGRFHSLKHLRVNITDESSHKIATYWVSACIGIHSFAMDCEERERGEDADSDDEPDPFIAEGLSSESESSDSDARVQPAHR